MKKAICHVELSGYFIKGDSYEVIHNEQSYAIVRDKTGMAHGLKEWKKHFQFN